MPRKRKAAKSDRLYTLKVLLIGGPVTEEFDEKNPEVSRTIRMRGDQTLEDLHEAIYDAFDRDDPHLYEFQFGKKPMDRRAARYVMSMKGDGVFAAFDAEDAAGFVEETTLDALALEKGRRFFYWFDFGDDWWHEIKVQAVESPCPPGEYPDLAEGVGASPPQYPGLEDDGDEDWDEEDEEDWDEDEGEGTEDAEGPADEPEERDEGAPPA